MIERRMLFEDGLKILEKIEGSKITKMKVDGASLESSTNRVEDYLILGRGSYGYIYRVDSENITVLPDGTIEFEDVDIPGAKYVIRAIREDEDLDNLNPETEQEGEE